VLGGTAVTANTATPTLLVDPELYATGDPYPLWRWMRENSPVHWHPPTHLPGFWSLTRYEDVRTVYRDPGRYSSARGVLLRPLSAGEDPGGGYTLALTDPPRHKQLRALFAGHFNTRTVRSLERLIRATVRATIAGAIDRGGCEFVHDVAGRLSMELIGHILGVAREDREALLRWTDEAFDAAVSLAAHQDLMRYFIALMDRRMAEPGDDLMSAMVAGMSAGTVTEEEILLNCENLVGATENGRLALAGGVLALIEHPDQWRRLTEDRGLVPAAAEEILRWTSSATHSMRTAAEAHVIDGQRIEAGDRVVVWIPSANRDGEVFTEPDEFDIGRTPNRHLALGTAEHFCLGATLARAQLCTLLTELLDTASRIEQTGPARRVRSIAVNGPEKLPVRIVTPRRSST
jgi:cytochrome P450